MARRKPIYMTIRDRARLDFADLYIDNGGDFLGAYTKLKKIDPAYEKDYVLNYLLEHF